MTNMYFYLTTRQSCLAFFLLLLYLTAVLWFIGIIPRHNDYQYLSQLIAGIFLVFFPHLFARQGIINPHKFLAGPTSFKLLGSWGQYLPINAPELGIFLVGVRDAGRQNIL